MRVEEIMTKQVSVCTAGTNAAKAAELMWIHDCGILPVVEDSSGRIVGVVTDRDLFIALGTKGQNASELIVGDVMRQDVLCCAPIDDLHSALKLMAEHQVHRLPVVDGNGWLTGILSLNDVVLHTKQRQNGVGVSYEDVVKTLMAVCRHDHQRKTAHTEAPVEVSHIRGAVA
jgi:CBS-domain-containing membrane protein